MPPESSSRRIPSTPVFRPMLRTWITFANGIVSNVPLKSDCTIVVARAVMTSL
jgi:hypothetical protein